MGFFKRDIQPRGISATVLNIWDRTHNFCDLPFFISKRHICKERHVENMKELSPPLKLLFYIIVWSRWTKSLVGLRRCRENFFPAVKIFPAIRKAVIFYVDFVINWSERSLRGSYISAVYTHIHIWAIFTKRDK